MKTAIRLLLICVVLEAPGIVDAQESRANGEVKVLSAGLSQDIQFDAHAYSTGRVTGEISVNGKTLSAADSEDGADPVSKVIDVSFSVDVDCLAVKKNRAVVGGFVRRSSSDRFSGRRVVLIVEEDPDAASSVAGKASWAMFAARDERWAHTDGELDSDTGAYTSWVATDAERPYDRGTVSGAKAKGEDHGCRAFLDAPEALTSVSRKDGRITIQP